MQKAIISLILLTLVMPSTWSQQDIYYGPKVGFNVSHLMISGQDGDLLKDESSMKLSTHIGGFVELVFSDFISLQPELLYNVKGATFKNSEEDDYKSAYVYKYLTLPVMFKYFVKERISIEGGPQFSYLLSAKNVEVNGIFSSNIGSEAAAINLYDDMKPIDLGFALGGGYISKSGFYLSARYEFGLFDVSKPQDTNNDLSLRNGNVMLSVGYSVNY